MYDALVYIAGAISAPTKNKMTRNINAGLAQAERFWVKWRIPAFSPHAQTGGLSNLYDEEDTNYFPFLAGDLLVIKRSTAVFLLPGWELSKGTLIEVKYANKIGVKTWESELALVEWIKRTCKWCPIEDLVEVDDA